MNITLDVHYLDMGKRHVAKLGHECASRYDETELLGINALILPDRRANSSSMD